MISDGWLRLDDAEQAQWVLLGALSGPAAPEHVELDLRWDALDASPSASVGVHYNQQDDRSAHDGSPTSPGASAGRQGSGYLFTLGQDGRLRLVEDQADGARAALAPPVPSTPLAAGQVVRVRVGVTADGRPFATRLDTGTTITSAAADSTFRGGYWSVGKSGHLGSRSSVGNVVVTP